MAALAAPPRGAFVLVGFMGAGKSTAAAELAAALGVAARDSDALLEARVGRTVAEEFEANPAFRADEEALVCELLDTAGAGDVVSLGGGSVLSQRVREALRRHVVVLLDVSPEDAWARVSAQDGGPTRPLARDRDAFVALYDERRPIYEQLADAHLPTSDRRLSDAVLRALRALAVADPGTHLLWAASASGEYPVMIGRGLLARGGTQQIEQAAGIERGASRAFAVSDANVWALYGTKLGGLAGSIAIAVGEEHKTLAGAEVVWNALLDADITRADHVVALGGGVVGDLAGFCAAAYQRGLPIVHVPTSLVAQVDSAYGGKTGVDLARAKNYVGAYHLPAGVLSDPELLSTLPPAELAAGWVEVLKTALIAGGSLWRRVAEGEDADEAIIRQCVQLKLEVVAADERDAGRRRVLNLGHTVGHAIEAATGYRRYRHGEAVGLGLLAALRLSGQSDLRAQVRALLEARTLPVGLAGATTDAVLDALAHDKKRVGARLPFVLVNAPGDVIADGEVAPEELRSAVQELIA
ncbi:MAG TPA: bifunctional shikimate kinase/3-dehydroquinate synthase [Solirubrobacteraceae bacterium]|jgi:shikimate kinase/3-dehydroquinate synthase|nr:bifunctional shikimate kinase/3-dehydroquinate synthase [Solirubrobacteraceae bacterium]